MTGFADQLKYWFLEKADRSDSRLLNKISDSLDRDRDVPFRILVWKAFIFFYSLITAPFNLRHCDKVGSKPRTRHRPFIKNMGEIIIGDEVNINSRNVQTDLVTGPEGHLEIGDQTSINFGVSIVSNKRVEIGKRVRIGPYSMIYDSNMHVQGRRYERAPGDPVTIGDDAWLASRVMIMKGSKIGKGSIVAAGSVVSGIVPPYVIVAGVPARIVKYIQPPEGSDFSWEHKKKTQSIDPGIYDRVRKVASDLFNMDMISIEPEDSHNSIKNWDAFRHVTFIRALEKEFDITFDEQDWSRLTSIKKAITIVTNYLEEKPVLTNYKE